MHVLSRQQPSFSCPQLIKFGVKPVAEQVAISRPRHVRRTGVSNIYGLSNAVSKNVQLFDFQSIRSPGSYKFLVWLLSQSYSPRAFSSCNSCNSRSNKNLLNSRPLHSYINSFIKEFHTSQQLSIRICFSLSLSLSLSIYLSIYLSSLSFSIIYFFINNGETV